VSSTLERLRFTTTEYTRMASILDGRRTELIDGEIIQMAPIGTAHLLVVSRLQHYLEQVMTGAGVRVLVQQPLIVGQFDEPQPALVVLREPLGPRKPRVADCLVVIEVADSTYATDVGIKLPAYLGAGVPQVWIVNISDHAHPLVEVWTPGSSQPVLATRTVSVAGTDLPLSAIFDRLADISPDEERA
jgi:Uma2 family endonuclease